MLEQTPKRKGPAISKRAQVIAYVAVVVTVLTYFGFFLSNVFIPRDHLQYVTKLQGTLTTLAQYKVTIFQRFSDYNTFYYARGQFCSKADMKCKYYREFGQPFDAQAEHDFATINSALSATGLEVDSVDVKIGAAGDVRYAEFGVRCLQCGSDRYAYALDTWNLPDEVTNNLWHPKITQDWYLIHESWH